jgi:spore coat protein U-like protein
MNSHFKKILAVAGISLIASGPSLAAQATTSFQVTASVLSACSVSATALAFGTYNPASGTDDDASSTISVTCTLLTPYTVKLDGGAAGNTAARVMDAGGTTDLGYQLYSDALRTTVWGNTVSDDIASTGLGLLPRQHTVYGRIVAGQDVETGSYADTINVAVDF